MAGTTRPYSIENGALSVPLHVLPMPNGRIELPNRTTAVYVEIGTNSFDTWDQYVLPRRPGAFLVSFEPLVDKWAIMLARGSKSRHAALLGHHHSRGVILPFAVSDKEGMADFHVSPRDGCSSLRAAHAPKHGAWARNQFVKGSCARTVQIRRVPCVTLRTVLLEWLGGHPVERIKVDAQGADLAVLSGAGAEALGNVAEVSMELVHDSCDPIYDGQPNCTALSLAMAGMGFVTRQSCADATHFGQNGCEANFLFRNSRGYGLVGGAERVNRSIALERAAGHFKGPRTRREKGGAKGAKPMSSKAAGARAGAKLAGPAGGHRGGGGGRHEAAPKAAEAGASWWG